MFALHIIKALSQEQQELNSVELTEKPVLLLFVTKRLFADKSHVSLFFCLNLYVTHALRGLQSYLFNYEYLH